jgi:hypothetical protein
LYEWNWFLRFLFNNLTFFLNKIVLNFIWFKILSKLSFLST